MDMKVTAKSLDHVLLFTIDVQLFSAFRKVKSEDIEAAKGVSLHPDDVLTLGSQRVFGKENLNVFNRLRDRMHRLCLKFGTPFLSGYAIPDTRADEAARELGEIVQQAMNEKANLLANYQQLLDDFCNRNADWAPQIRAKAFSEAYIDDRVKFAFHGLRVSAARDSGAMAQGLDDQVGGLLGSLLRDVAQVAEELQRGSLSGKEKVTRKALRPLKAVREKILGFTFLDPRVQAVADMIDSVCAALPADGPIEGTNLAMLWGITGMLADPRRVMAVADGYDPGDPGSFLDSLRPAPSVIAQATDASIAVMPDAHALMESLPVGLPQVDHNQFADPYGGLFPDSLEPAIGIPVVSHAQDDLASFFGV